MGEDKQVSYMAMKLIVRQLADLMNASTTFFDNCHSVVTGEF